jgi:uncharacterized protein
MICVPDSSTLIILSKLEQIELLTRLYSQVIIAPRVWDEVIEKGKEAGATDVIFLEKYINGPEFKRIRLTTLEKELVLNLRKKGNGAGESEVIILASKRKAIAILDDKNARTSAISMGIQPTGTIGVIYESFLRELISYPTLVGLLGKFGRIAWISPDLLADIIRRAGEEKT